MIQILMVLAATISFTVATIFLKLLTQNWNITHLTIVFLMVMLATALEFLVLRRGMGIGHLAVLFAAVDILMAAVSGHFVNQETVSELHLAAICLAIAATILVTIANNP